MYLPVSKKFRFQSQSLITCCLVKYNNTLHFVIETVPNDGPDLLFG